MIDIDEVSERLADEGVVHGLLMRKSQAEQMRENLRSALTHGKRDKARTV
jgi:hypothetical protein